MQHTQKSSGRAATPTPKQSLKENQWKGLIQQCQASGETIKSWCRSNGINENTYYYWLKRLRKNAVDQHSDMIASVIPKEQEIVEIPAVAVRAAASEPVVGNASLQLSFKGACMTVESGTSPELLRMVLSELNHLSAQ